MRLPLCHRCGNGTHITLKNPRKCAHHLRLPVYCGSEYI